MQYDVNYNDIWIWTSKTILRLSHIACHTHQFTDLSEATWEKEKQNIYIRLVATVLTI
jgi:hypothetical protein